ATGVGSPETFFEFLKREPPAFQEDPTWREVRRLLGYDAAGSLSMISMAGTMIRLSAIAYSTFLRIKTETGSRCSKLWTISSAVMKMTSDSRVSVQTFTHSGV